MDAERMGRGAANPPALDRLEPRLLLTAAGWSLPYANLSQTSLFAQGSTHIVRSTPYHLLWPAMVAANTVLTGDVNGDGQLEVVIGQDAQVSVFSSSGGSLNTLNGAGHLDLLADVTGDGVPEIITSDVAAGNVARIRAFNAAGAAVRTFAKQGNTSQAPQVTAVAVADLNGDGKLELVVDWQTAAHSPRGIILFNAATTAQIASYSIGPVPNGRASIGDITGDGKLEILLSGSATSIGVTGADGSSYNASYTWVLDSSGKLIWQRGPFQPTPYDNCDVLSDVDGDGVQEAIGTLSTQESSEFTASWGEVAVMEGTTGATRDGYRRYFDSPVKVVGVADLKPEATKEILLLQEDPTAHLYRLLAVDSTAGFPTWKSFDLGSTRPSSVVVNDINGDGKLEVLVDTGTGGKLFVLGSDLTPQWQWTSGGPPIHQVIVSDVNDDGANEILIAYGASSGANAVVVLAGNAPAADAPSNDDRGDAIPLSGMQATVTGSNVNATQEQNECVLWSPAQAGHSVWWRWTAPVSGSVTIDTFGSDFDTQLLVDDQPLLTGTNTGREGNSDDCGSLQSRLHYQVTAGETLLIGVDGSGTNPSDDMGNITLHLSEVEASTSLTGTYDQAAVISGETATMTGISMPGSPLYSQYWWTWTAPQKETVTIDTFGSEFDTNLTVYANYPNLVAGNDDWNGLQSLVQFNAIAGQVYKIRVNSLNNETGTIALNLSAKPNHAPVLDNTGSMKLNTMFVGQTNAGTRVSDLIASAGGNRITDADDGDGEGIAVVATDQSHGTWQYCPDGTNWFTFSGYYTTARLLTAETYVRFVPAAGYTGTIAKGITFRAWDRTDGSNGGTLDSTTNGGSTSLSVKAQAASVTVKPPNHAPVLDTASPMMLGNVVAGRANTGTKIADLIASAGGDRITDADAGALEGIGIIATVNTNGSWQFSTNGGTTWTAFNACYSSTRVLAADANTYVRFVPKTGYSGTVTGGLTLKAWDQTSGINGGAISTLASSGTTAVSSAAEAINITVLLTNHAPVLDNTGIMTLSKIIVGNTNAGMKVSDLIASAGGNRITDADASAKEGIAIVATDTANGTWQYSLDGKAWGTFKGYYSSARLLSANAYVRFVPNMGYKGTMTAGITFRAWDQTDGVNGGTLNALTSGGNASLSVALETAGVVVSLT